MPIFGISLVCGDIKSETVGCDPPGGAKFMERVDLLFHL